MAETPGKDLLFEVRVFLSQQYAELEVEKRKLSIKLSVEASKQHASFDEVARTDPDISFGLGRISRQEELLKGVQELVFPYYVEQSVDDIPTS